MIFQENCNSNNCQKTNEWPHVKKLQRPVMHEIQETKQYQMKSRSEGKLYKPVFHPYEFSSTYFTK